MSRCLFLWYRSSERRGKMLRRREIWSAPRGHQSCRRLGSQILARPLIRQDDAELRQKRGNGGNAAFRSVTEVSNPGRTRCSQPSGTAIPDRLQFFETADTRGLLRRAAVIYMKTKALQGETAKDDSRVPMDWTGGVSCMWPSASFASTVRSTSPYYWTPSTYIIALFHPTHSSILYN